MLIFVALNDESVPFVPLDVKKRELIVGRGDRIDVPDSTRPKAREDLPAGPPSVATWERANKGAFAVI